MTEKLWDLTFSIEGDNIDLEQDAGCGDVARITLHRVHLRLLAERAGLLAPDSEAPRTIARLGRQLRTLLERINQLDDWLNAAAQRCHEDLEMETTYSFATWELAREFVQDLPPQDGTCHRPAMANAMAEEPKVSTPAVSASGAARPAEVQPELALETGGAS